MDLMETYRLKYDFGEYTSAVDSLLNRILTNSTSYFAKQLKNNEIKNVTSEYLTMFDCICYTEEYLYASKNNPNFYNILHSISDVNIISVLPQNRRGIYGQTFPDIHAILINPELSGSKTLTPAEITRLYTAHELGHCINENWMQSVLNHINEQIRLGNIRNREDAQLFYDGFSLLDEATTQDRAEDFAYTFAGKTRPPMGYRSNPLLFDGTPYKTNFDFYGELQIPATMFGRTLRGIGNINDDGMALSTLSQRALKSSFVEEILQEYNRDGQLQNLYPEIKNMGIIKNASYASFGEYPDQEALSNSKSALIGFSRLANSLRDYREPFSPRNINR